MAKKENRIKNYFKNVNAAGEPELKKMDPAQQPFGKINFIMIGVCVAMIVIGFLLMCGPGSSIEGGFNPDIFSVRRIVVGPTVAFLGFLALAFSIIWTPRSRRKGEHDNHTDIK